METDKLTELIIACAYQVHNTLGAGFLEKVYENALLIELKKHDLKVKQQYPIPVFYEDQQVGDFYADLIVNDDIVIKLKAVENLLKQHYVQLVNYLNGIEKDIGLLINFGSSVTVKENTGVTKKYPLDLHPVTTTRFFDRINNKYNYGPTINQAMNPV